VTTLPPQARDVLMRAWLEILREQHPGTSWVAVKREQDQLGRAGDSTGAVMGVGNAETP